MQSAPYLLTLVGTLHLAIAVGASIYIISKRPAIGVALAWMFLIAVIPLIGGALYLLFGERRTGHRRARDMTALRSDYEKIWRTAVFQPVTDVDWSRHPPMAQGLDRIGRQVAGSPTVRGSQASLISDPQDCLLQIASDIEAAQTSVLMEFYIWSEGGAADDVLEAVIRAAKRGVHCRVLLDALGAHPWWRGPQPRRLRDAGVELMPAMPLGLFRAFIGRSDLRLHRKIVVVDGAVAWTGSMNLVDPRYFKQDAGVGEWVDAMVRLEGAAIVPLAATVIGDWSLETREPIDALTRSAALQEVTPNGPTDIQVLATGPGETQDGLLQMLLVLINAAQQELRVTTPYFVPDPALLPALRSAANRGVKVSIIVPAKVDSILTRFASRSYYQDFKDCGVAIHLFEGGLLHTKSITVDGSISMFGTVNFDMRSLWLNYEVALFVYDAGFTAALRGLQQSYIDESQPLDFEAWAARPFRYRFLEDTLRLFSPIT
ncbi:MAG: cardiolipin synthase [Alphaproteobacteria bacterium]|nr:cardiolipin synthase [Alphaproteobacteria bacterium]